MKKLAIGMLSVLMAGCLASAAWAQGNPRGMQTLTTKAFTVSVDYGRPALKGRTTDALLGRLKPGGLWRLGADSSTTFKTSADLMFGDVAIPAGEYSIWMQRQADNSWKLLFDKQHGQWGEPAPDPSECFAAVPLEEGKPAAPVEMVTISTTNKGNHGGVITIEWGTLKAWTHFEAK